MTKKSLVLPAAALLLLCLANMRPCCRLSVDGRELPGLWSPAAMHRGIVAAERAIEELSPERQELPPLEKHWQLRLSPAAGESRDLSMALISACPELQLGQGVYVGGQHMGCVADGRELMGALQEHIRMSLPTWAKTGYLSSPVYMQPQFSRKGRICSSSDMVLLMTGHAPVMYSDMEGYISRV